MNVKNIVKVMNFHSLIRVDKAKKLEAEILKHTEDLMLNNVVIVLP